jgi:Ca2+-binding RTX toxin-like protein
MTTTNPFDGLLAIRNGSITARWNFYDAVGTPVSSPGGIGNAAAVTFSFLTTVPSYYSSTPTTGFVQFFELHKQAARDVLASIANVVHLSFSEVSGVGDITFAMNAQSGSSGYAYFPGFSYYYTGETITSVSAGDLAGDVWLNGNRTWAANDFAVGGPGYGALVHELGHALGLKHPFEATPGGYILDVSLDNTKYTVMSYTQHPYSYYRTVNETSPGSYSWQYEHIQPETLMPLDIKALQYLYGANTSFHSGNDTYTFDTNRPFIQTIWDGGGNDTISVSNFSLGSVIDLRDGYFSSIRIPSDPLPPGQVEHNSGIYDGTDNLGIAYGSIIENAIGGKGDDQLYGNAVANTLSSNAGADKLDGRGGADTMIGGDGSDTYYVRDSGDVVIESNATASSGGTDLVNSYLGGYTLGTNIENGRIMATGVANLTGNGLNNTLYTGAGNNTLNGSTGADTVSYTYANAAVVVSLASTTAQPTGSSGSDTLLNIENLTGSPATAATTF